MQNHQRQLLDDILDSALDQLDSGIEGSTNLSKEKSQECVRDGLHKAKDEAGKSSIAGTDSSDVGKNPSKENVNHTTTMSEKAANNPSYSDLGISADDFGERIMSELMRDFETMSGKDDATAAMDVIMRQLLSKDLMYEPMKQVTDKFPKWLAEKKSSLSEAEYNRYGKQYQYFQKILYLYDTDPDNIGRLMELMQDIQEFGQPPAEIIKELAPDLDIDSDGIPSGFDFPFPNFGDGFPTPANGPDDCKMQ